MYLWYISKLFVLDQIRIQFHWDWWWIEVIDFPMLHQKEKYVQQNLQFLGANCLWIGSVFDSIIYSIVKLSYWQHKDMGHMRTYWWWIVDLSKVTNIIQIRCIQILYRSDVIRQILQHKMRNLILIPQCVLNKLLSKCITTRDTLRMAC